MRGRSMRIHSGGPHAPRHTPSVNLDTCDADPIDGAWTQRVMHEPGLAAPGRRRTVPDKAWRANRISVPGPDCVSPTADSAFVVPLSNFPDGPRTKSKGPDLTSCVLTDKDSFSGW